MLPREIMLPETHQTAKHTLERGQHDNYLPLLSHSYLKSRVHNTKRSSQWLREGVVNLSVAHPADSRTTCSLQISLPSTCTNSHPTLRVKTYSWEVFDHGREDFQWGSLPGHLWHSVTIHRFREFPDWCAWKFMIIHLPSDTCSKMCVTFSDCRMCLFKYLVKIPVLLPPSWTSKASASSHLYWYKQTETDTNDSCLFFKFFLLLLWA